MVIPRFNDLEFNLTKSSTGPAPIKKRARPGQFDDVKIQRKHFHKGGLRDNPKRLKLSRTEREESSLSDDSLPQRPQGQRISNKGLKRDKHFLETSWDESQVTPPSSSPSLFSDLPLTSFSLHPELVKILKDKMNIERLTRIQAESIPILLKGQDLFMQAQTGSGKTLAYLLPLIHSLLVSGFYATNPNENPPGKSPERKPETLNRSHGTFAIIMVPTRELALQIFGVASILCRPFLGLVPGLLIGGEKRKSEKARIRRGLSVIVATPGRLVDHFNSTQSFQWNRCKWVILDEGDQLLELGFEPSIREVFRMLKPCHELQSILSSATASHAISELSRSSLKPGFKVVKVSLGSMTNTKCEDEAEIPIYDIPSTISQHVVICQAKHKMILLFFFLSKHLKKWIRIIVFFSTCDEAEFAYQLLTNIGIGCGDDMCKIFQLHGQLDQLSRKETYSRFSQASHAVLCCTDVASRGLDFNNITWIVQYDAPTDTTSYIHRIGRTARMGKIGKVLLMLLHHEIGYIEALQKQQRMSFRVIKTEDLMTVPTQSRGKKTISPAQMLLEMKKKIFDLVDENSRLKETAVRAMRSFVRSYTTHQKSVREIFNIKHLHLGHIASSFGLTDPPSSFSSGGRALKDGPKKNKTKKNMEKGSSDEHTRRPFNSGSFEFL